jgi:hypothetical protein
VAVIKVADANCEALEDENPESDESNPGKDDGTHAFLKDRNSDLITYEEKKQLYLMDVQH